MVIYRYGLKARIPEPGAVPKGGLIAARAISFTDGGGCFYYGFAEYDHILTPDEIEHYDFALVGVRREEDK